ncbi:hypothetical protein [Alcanivorax sp.]|uniref:hypothetical protein n=1 Tax=Alcanivorax sp. TaxID=1872427 RepID=UPI003BA8B678
MGNAVAAFSCPFCTGTSTAVLSLVTSGSGACAVFGNHLAITRATAPSNRR